MRQNLVKLFVIRTDDGSVKIKILSNNAKIPVRGTSKAVSYDLTVAQPTVVPAHGKCLVKTGLSLAMPSGCYGRIAPRSGFSTKEIH